ncbi:hypothetical protein [Cupriavidus necator]|uniref:hypothetical protein n=1 Tax=Cupriavidus necator TaxID=106590 RepID=UPI00339D7216
MTSSQDPRLGACVYLLHMLLQRTEATRPGFIEQMIRGVAADRDAMPADAPGRAEALPVFEETLRILTLANEQLEGTAPRP